MSLPTQRSMPLEGSWRMVEGDQDSYDTSIVPHYDDEFQPSNGPSQASGGVSQDNYSIGGSQDKSTVRDFISRADDERVILRSPFQPSVPQNVRENQVDRRGGSDRTSASASEFVMPRVEADDGRARDTRVRHGHDDSVVRRRPGKAPQVDRRIDHKDGPNSPGAAQIISQRLTTAVPVAIFDVFAWIFNIIGMAFRFIQKPLAILLAVYLVFGGLLVLQDMLTKSVFASFSPICRIPGVGHLGLPFCPMTATYGTDVAENEPVIFDDLMKVQDDFENIMEKTALTVSLPNDLQQSIFGVQNLRGLIQYSSIPNKGELVLEFDGYITEIKQAIFDVMSFDNGANGAVDTIIGINKWTIWQLDDFASRQREQEASHGWLADSTYMLFRPFQRVVVTEQVLVDQYRKHTAFTVEKIEDLINDAEKLLRTLDKADKHLDRIHSFIARTQPELQSRKDEVFPYFYNHFFRTHIKEKKEINKQLDLLQKAHVQQQNAIRWLSEMMMDLKKIHSGLDDLKERVSAPGQILAVGGSLPLKVHIEVIDNGISRMQEVRDRIRPIRKAKEDEALRQSQANRRT